MTPARSCASPVALSTIRIIGVTSLTTAAEPACVICTSTQWLSHALVVLVRLHAHVGATHRHVMICGQVCGVACMQRHRRHGLRRSNRKRDVMGGRALDASHRIHFKRAPASVKLRDPSQRRRSCVSSTPIQRAASDVLHLLRETPNDAVYAGVLTTIDGWRSSSGRATVASWLTPVPRRYRVAVQVRRLARIWLV